MVSLEERKDILDDEVEILEKKGWTVVSRTETTCFLTKEAEVLGCLTSIAAIMTLFVFTDSRSNLRTRTVEISPDGKIKRSWLKL